MQDEVISNAKSKIFSFVDEKSFVEFDGIYDEGVIAGYATVNGRPVCLFAQDSSIMSGAITKNGCEKICKVIDMAAKNGVPLIGFYDSIGAKISEGTKVLAGMQMILARLANLSGVVPIISVVLGSVTGVATFSLGFSDFVFMIDGESKVFMNGPQVLTATTGKDILVENIGGAKAHFNETGVCHFCSDNWQECNLKLKELLSYLPDNNLSDSEILDNDDINRTLEELTSENVTFLDVITAICDEGKFLEVSLGFASNIVIGFSRIGGRVVGIVCNNGKVNCDSIDKATGFVMFCDAFNIPLVTLIDSDGFEESVEAELNGIVRKSAKLFYAYSDATVAKISVIFGKAYGGTSLMMGTGADIVMAWDSSKISVIEPKSAVNILFSDDIVNAECPVEFRESKLNEYMENEALPCNAIKDGFIDIVISPVETRKMIISALDMFSSKREEKLSRKHGNMPL